MNALIKLFFAHQFTATLSNIICAISSRFGNRKLPQLAFVFLSLILVSSNLTGCMYNVAPPSSEARRYKMTGKILNVDKSRRRVQIAHNEIDDNQGGTYMEAMTMDFALRDEALFDEMKSGDEINATLVIDKGRSYLDDVSVSRPMSDGQSAAALNSAARLEPQPGDSIPNFTLVNQDGKTIRLADYEDRMLLITFIYTRCPLPDYCPLMSENFATIKKAIDSDSALRDRVRLLSITFDPLYDTPAVLREYAARYDANTSAVASPRTWEFATGSPAQINGVAKLFNLTYTPTPDGTINHSLKTALIDSTGKLVKLYRDNEWKPRDVTREIERHYASNR